MRGVRAVAACARDGGPTENRRQTAMSRKRRSYEAGHKPKFLVIIDDTPECDRAVYFADGGGSIYRVAK